MCDNNNVQETPENHRLLVPCFRGGGNQNHRKSHSFESHHSVAADPSRLVLYVTRPKVYASVVFLTLQKWDQTYRSFPEMGVPGRWAPRPLSGPSPVSWEAPRARAVIEAMLFFRLQAGSLGGSFCAGGYYPITILLKTPGKVAKAASKWRCVKFKVRNQERCWFYFSFSPHQNNKSTGLCCLPLPLLWFRKKCVVLCPERKLRSKTSNCSHLYKAVG